MTVSTEKSIATFVSAKMADFRKKTAESAPADLANTCTDYSLYFKGAADAIKAIGVDTKAIASAQAVIDAEINLSSVLDPSPAV